MEALLKLGKYKRRKELYEEEGRKGGKRADQREGEGRGVGRGQTEGLRRKNSRKFLFDEKEKRTHFASRAKKS
jgi:hypothetical protein